MIGLVLVSHSADLVTGLRELVQQMADEVVIAIAGGDEDGGLGTSMEKVAAAIEEADQGDGVVLLYDLGSAKLSSEMAIEMLAEEQQDRVRLVDAALVEGALAAATTVTDDSSLDDVVAAARGAVGPAEDQDGPAGDDDASAGDGGAPDSGGDEVERIIELTNEMGLHARPAGTLSRRLKELDATLHIEVVGGDEGRVNAASTLSVVSLGATKGAELRLIGGGPDAEAAVEAATEVLQSAE